MDSLRFPVDFIRNPMHFINSSLRVPMLCIS